jgi:hypothetical protein
MKFKTIFIFAGLKIAEVLAAMLAIWLFLNIGYWAYSSGVMNPDLCKSSLEPIWSLGGFFWAVKGGFVVLWTLVICACMLVGIFLLVKTYFKKIGFWFVKSFSSWVTMNWNIARKISKEDL